MNPAQTYLRLPDPIALDLRWSVDDNVLEYAGSQTSTRRTSARVTDEPRTVFAFAEEVAEFLEGFAGWRPLIHFGFMVQLLMLLRPFPPRRHPGMPRNHLRKLFADHCRSLRHAGAFCAQLCREVPDALEADALPEIFQQLRRRDVTIHWVSLGQTAAVSEHLPWAPEAFEARVLKELERFHDEDIRHWLEHGRGPVQEAAKALAREIPLGLAGRLAQLLERPRLAGAQAFVKQLSGALVLPPRRLTYQDLPLGGFTDVTTRGNVEHILPSQFALDEWDFFRRFAEHELLYFRREDPNAPTRQDLVVLLDQGVRTWGDVRLVLGAALLTLGRQALRRRIPFYLATTAGTGLLDPLQVSQEELGQVVEASDLSANPGLALESLLEQPAELQRDIVLLTHPRSLIEEEVRTAAKRARPGTRLFALTLDRLGQAGLDELRHGTAVPVRQFHVDLSQAEPQAPQAPAWDYSGWSGDVEPIGFPFRFGIDGKIPAGGFDFDGRERYLLTACRQGLLHLWDVQGTLLEVLPRAFFNGKLVTEVQAVVGAADGFVVVGRLDNQWAGIHYQLARRRCKVHPFGLSHSHSYWGYSWAHHCFLALDKNHEGEGHGIDLSTGERFATNLGGGSTRVQAAWDAWVRNQVPVRQLDVQPSKYRPYVTLNPVTGEVEAARIEPPCKFSPMGDGEPMLRDFELLEAQLGFACLALRVRRRKKPKESQLLVFDVNETLLTCISAIGDHPWGYRLSPGGKFLARQIGNSVVAYGPSTGQTAPRQTGVGGFAQALSFSLGDQELFIFPGSRRLYHHLKWSEGRLVVASGFLPANSKPSTVGGNSTIPEPLRYDPERWLRGSQKRLTAVSDCYGHVAIFDKDERLVCMFMAFRNRLAGWLPDGTYFGPALMTGKPHHADALAKFGRALREAP